MTYLVNKETVEKFQDLWRHLRYYIPEGKRVEASALAEALDDVWFKSPQAEPTMLVSVEEFTRLHQRLAEAEALKERVRLSLVGLHTLIGEGGTPILTEALLYDVLGKEDTRSLLHAVSEVARAAGLDAYRDVDMPANLKLNAARRFSVSADFPDTETMKTLIKEFRAYVRETIKEGDHVPTVSGVLGLSKSALWHSLTDSYRDWLLPRVKQVAEKVSVREYYLIDDER